MLRPEHERITANEPEGAAPMNEQAVILIGNTLSVLVGLSACSLVVAQEGGPDEQTEIPRAFNGQPMTAERMGKLLVGHVHIRQW